MTRAKWVVLALVLAVVGGTAALLNRSKSLHRLGQPGLKLVQQPVYDSNTNIIGHTTVPLPGTVLNHHSFVMPISTMEVTWLPKDTTFARRYYMASNEPSFLLSVILMGTDRGSIHQPQICLTGQGWQIDKAASTLDNVPVASPHPYDLPVMKVLSSKTARDAEGREVALRSLYVYWFVADGALTARHGQRMWWMTRELLRTGTLQRWGYVACWAQCLPGQEDALYARMKTFIAAAVPQFQLATGPVTSAPRNGR
jgi:hypothetical protein